MIELPQPTNKSKICKIRSEQTSYFVVAFSLLIEAPVILQC